MDGGKDGPHHRTGDGNLGQLEGNGAGVTDDAGTNLDQLELRHPPAAGYAVTQVTLCPNLL